MNECLLTTQKYKFAQLYKTGQTYIFKKNTFEINKRLIRFPELLLQEFGGSWQKKTLLARKYSTIFQLNIQCC